MKLIITSILIFLLYHFANSQSPKVEIYFLKSRLAPVENKAWPNYVVRHFVATKNDLADSAFIHDSEILAYDTTQKIIHITGNAALKISELEPPIPDGIQFVLTVDKEPVLAGYFINRSTSEPVVSYMIMNRKDTLCHIDRLLPGVEIDDRKSNTLVDAFRFTNRLR